VDFLFRRISNQFPQTS